ncbi:hypothetical protein [Arthrobacter sp. USHLN218]|uniref:hypothetical protein n=1 Tax=Arthrobacter sp. USHLN218 TaxID=3081232 RepID=UPI003016A0CC
MPSIEAAPPHSTEDPRPLRVLKKTGVALLAASLLVYPALVLAVNTFAPHTVARHEFNLIQDDPVSPAGYLVLLIGVPLSVALLGLRAVLSTHGWNSSGFTRLQRGITLILGLAFTALFAVLAFWAAFFYGLLVNAALH